MVVKLCIGEGVGKGANVFDVMLLITGWLLFVVRVGPCTVELGVIPVVRNDVVKPIKTKKEKMLCRGKNKEFCKPCTKFHEICPNKTTSQTMYLSTCNEG